MATSAKPLQKRRTKDTTLMWSRSSEAGRGMYGRAAWRHIRQMHLAQHPYCEECVKAGLPSAMCIPLHPHVDHIEPHRGDWGAFHDADNLQTLCPMHHSMKTMAEQQQQ